MSYLLSVVFITYNRSDLLSRSFMAIKAAIEQCGLQAEYIVSDDASAPHHQAAISGLPFDKVVFAPRNQGMGANTNKGLRAAMHEFILHIQDDWEFVGQPSMLGKCLEILQRNPDIGVLQLTDVHSDLPVLKRKLGTTSFAVFRNDGLPWRRKCSVRPYSDCPHIKRVGFLRDLGPYREGVAMGACENDFKRRVAIQRKWRVAHIGGPPLFRHLGAAASFNVEGQAHPVVTTLRAIPRVGPALALALRRIMSIADHLCAVLWSSVFCR